METIDLVVPYVDSSDPLWQEDFFKYNPKEINKEEVNASNRFRGQGDFFKYFFRCVAQNIPWIHNIFLIVARESQVPKWINRDKVKIVLHKDFIPEEFLPTFNSCTIENFVPFIPNLSDKFLYANDDMFIIKPLTIQHFFKGDYVRTNTKAFCGYDLLYGSHILNAYSTIFNIPREELIKRPYIATLGHAIRPYLRDICKNCFKSYESKILNSITKFRDAKNYNMYIYDYYHINTHNQTYRDGMIISYVGSKTSESTYLNIFNQASMICLNDDDPNIDLYSKEFIKVRFEMYFPCKSKYEN